MLRGHGDLKVYQLSYKLAMEIFNLSRAFPREEIYSLTNQIRALREALLQTWRRASERDVIQTCLSTN